MRVLLAQLPGLDPAHYPIGGDFAWRTDRQGAVTGSPKQSPLA